MLATAVGFELQLHSLPPDGMVEQATAIWPLAAGLEAFQWYSEWLKTAPSELETEFATATTPMGQVATVGFYNWDPDNSSDVNEAIEVIYTNTCGKETMCPLHFNAASNAHQTSAAATHCMAVFHVIVCL